MNRLNAHRQILLTPWRRSSDSSPWSWALMVALLLLALAPTGLALRYESVAVAQGFAVSTAAFVMELLWLIQLASMLRQNHPSAARLVPGHVQRLRETLVALFIAIALATAALLGARFGHPLAWGLAAGLVMLMMALMQRHPLLWTLCWILPSSASWWTQTALWRALRGLALTVYETQPLALALAGLLLLPWLASRLLHDGEAAHAAGFKRNEQRRRALQLASIGQSNLRDQGRAAHFFAEAFLFIYRRWMPHLIATAQPTARSVMARAELACGANSHWATHLGSLILFACIAAAVWAVVHFGYGVQGWQFMQGGGIGMTIGITFAAILPVLSVRSTLYGTRREQALLMLLPGMPRGAALNQRLARRQMLHFLASWGASAALVCGVVGESEVEHVVLGYIVAWLPAGLLLWRDWSRLPPPTAVNAMLPVFGVMLAGAAVGAATKWLTWSPDVLIVVVAVGTMALGTWRWRRLATYAQAFPVGRRT